MFVKCNDFLPVFAGLSPERPPQAGQGRAQTHQALPLAPGRHAPLPSAGGHSPVDCPGRVGEGHFAWPSSSELGLGRHVASWD